MTGLLLKYSVFPDIIPVVGSHFTRSSTEAPTGMLLVRHVQQCGSVYSSVAATVVTGQLASSRGIMWRGVER